MREFRRVGVSMVLLLAVAAPTGVTAADGEPSAEAETVEIRGDDAQLAICFPDVCLLLGDDVAGSPTPAPTHDPAVAEPSPEPSPAAPGPTDDGDPDPPVVEAPPEAVDPNLPDLLAGIRSGGEQPDFDALGVALLSGAHVRVVEADAEFDRPILRAGADADLAGTWKVTNRKATMLCSPPGGGRKRRQSLKKTVDTVTIARDERGILVGEGMFEELVDMTRLGPGVYGMAHRSKQGGQTVQTRSFLVVESGDAFSGTTLVHLSGNQGECTMARGFKGKRTR